MTSANSFDEQARMESARNLHAGLSSGADLILHAVGWLENGRTVSVEKFESDCDWLVNFLPEDRLKPSRFLPLTDSQKSDLSLITKELKQFRR